MHKNPNNIYKEMFFLEKLNKKQNLMSTKLITTVYYVQSSMFWCADSICAGSYKGNIIKLKTKRKTKRNMWSAKFLYACVLVTVVQ